MKKCFLSILVLSLVFTNLFSQENVSIKFLDGCKNFEKIDSVIFLSINGEDLEGDIKSSHLIIDGINYINGYFKDGLNFNMRFHSDESMDTLELPRLRIEYSGGMHSRKLNYVDCGELLNGEFSESWKNGLKRFEGLFSNGKPISFEQYDRKGLLLSKDYYKGNKAILFKSEYFDTEENLLWYMIYKKKKIKIFDHKHKRVSKGRLKDFFERVEWRPTIPIYAGGLVGAYD